jgi:wobble nucleotide-excising tRNase
MFHKSLLFKMVLIKKTLKNNCKNVLLFTPNENLFRNLTYGSFQGPGQNIGKISKFWHLKNTNFYYPTFPLAKA